MRALKWGSYALFSLAISTFPSLAHAGAWPLPEHTGQIIQTSSIATANNSFDANGHSTQPAQFSKYEAALFWEHGLTKDYTLTLTSSYQDLNYRAGVDDVSFSGFGETGVSVRRPLWKKEQSLLSAQASILFAGPGETITDADLGTGTTQYEARLLAGHSFKFADRDGFIDAQAAWRFRKSPAPDEWRFDVTAGWRPSPKFQILAQGFYVQSTSAPGLARNSERLKLQTSIVYDRSKRTSYQIGSYSTVAGKNIVQENALFISIWQRY